MTAWPRTQLPRSQSPEAPEAGSARCRLGLVARWQHAGKVKHDLSASRVFHLTLACSLPFCCAAPRDTGKRQGINSIATTSQPHITHVRFRTRWIAKQSTRLIFGASRRARPTTARRATMPSRRSWLTSSSLLLSTTPSYTGMRCEDDALPDSH